MTTYYADPTATGNDDGTTQTDAWTTLQRAIDGTDGIQPTAGDTVLCKANGSTADETLAATIDFDGSIGSYASGPVIFRGVNSSWVDDDTRYLINCNSQSIGINFAQRFCNVENMEFYGGVIGVDFTQSTSTGNPFSIWTNVVSRDHSSSGFNNYYYYINLVFIKCAAYGNTASGWAMNNSAGSSRYQFYFCRSYDNGIYGIEDYCALTGLVFGCVMHDNGGSDLYLRGPASVINCVTDASDDHGILISGLNLHILIGNRATNNGVDGTGYGLYGTTAGGLVLGWNYFGGNNDGAISYAGGYLQRILDAGSNTNEESGTDSDEGYTDSASDDYNLAKAATLRSTPIELL